MGAAEDAGPPDAPPAADESYGVYLTIIDLARARQVVGFYDFKAHTGLSSSQLQQYLDDLAQHDYLQTIHDTTARISYQATRRMHNERAQDILREVAMDGEV